MEPQGKLTREESFQVFEEVFDALLLSGMEAVDERPFVRAWESCGPLRSQAVVFLVRKTLSRYRDGAPLPDVLSRSINFCFKYLARRHISMFFDLSCMAFDREPAALEQLLEAIGPDGFQNLRGDVSINFPLALVRFAQTVEHASDELMEFAIAGASGLYFYDF